MHAYMSMARYLGQFISWSALEAREGLAAQANDVTHRPRSALLTRLSSDSLIGVGKNWVVEVADSSINVFAISLDRFSTKVSSIRRGPRNLSTDGSRRDCLDAMLGG